MGATLSHSARQVRSAAAHCVAETLVGQYTLAASHVRLEFWHCPPCRPTSQMYQGARMLTCCEQQAAESRRCTSDIYMAACLRQRLLLNTGGSGGRMAQMHLPVNISAYMCQVHEHLLICLRLQGMILALAEMFASAISSGNGSLTSACCQKRCGKTGTTS